MSMTDPDTTDAPETPAGLGKLAADRVNLEKKRRHIEAQLDAISAAIRQLDAQLLDQFAESGVKRLNVDGITLYTRVDRYVTKRKDVATETVIEAMRLAGLGDLCSESYSASALKSRVVEMLTAGEELPAELAECLSIGEVPRIVATAEA